MCLLLWSSTINPEDVEVVIATRKESDPHFTSLKNKLSIFNEKNSRLLNSFILDRKHSNRNEINIVVSSQENNKYGWISLSNIPSKRRIYGDLRIKFCEQINHSSVKSILYQGDKMDNCPYLPLPMMMVKSLPCWESI